MQEKESMKNIRDLELVELKSLCKEEGFPAYRAEQLFSWLHEKAVEEYTEMTNIPKAMREKLSEGYSIALPKADLHLCSKMDDTEKFLFRLSDGHKIESVFMRYQHGNSACISTQVGCRMGCAFCASTLDGLARNCSTGEMLGQIYAMEKLTGQRISHVVLMGSGEPLDNYEEVTRFLRIISDEKGKNLSIRNITLSTCGLVPRIYDLAKENYGITLALSLHAPTDEQRRKIMPIAKRYSLSEIMPAVKEYFKKTGRRVSFEYALVLGVNDGEEDRRALADLLRGGTFSLSCESDSGKSHQRKDFCSAGSEEGLRLSGVFTEKRHYLHGKKRDGGRYCRSLRTITKGWNKRGLRWSFLQKRIREKCEK